MKKNILFLLTTIFVSSSIFVSAFAHENKNVIQKFGEEININLDNNFRGNIELNTSDIYKIDVEENSIQFTDETGKDMKYTFNETIDLNNASIANTIIDSVSNSQQISVYHTHKWEKVGTWESGGQTGPLYYCFGCDSMLLG